LGNPPLQDSNQGGTTKPLKYSTKLLILFDVGVGT